MADDVQITVGVALDNLNDTIEQAKAQFGGLKDALTAVIAVGGLGVLIEQLTEFATQVETSATVLGIGTTSIQDLGLMAQMSGGSMQEITMALQRMDTMAQRGTLSTSAQGAALKALGINAQQFVSVPADQKMALLADAVQRLNAQGINAAPALALISRGLAQMEPELERGSAGIKEFQEQMISAGAIMTGNTLQGLTKLGDATVVMMAAWKNLLAVLIEKTPLTEIVVALGNAAGAMMKLASASQLAAYFVTAMDDAEASLMYRLTGMDKFLQQHIQFQAQLNDMLKQSAAAYAKQAAAQQASEAALKVNLGAQQEQHRLIQATTDAIKLQEDEYKRATEAADTNAKLFLTSEAQKKAALIAAVDEQINKELALNQAELNGLAKGTEAYSHAVSEREEILRKGDKEIQKIDDQTAIKVTQDWTKMADSLASGFSSGLDKVLSKQESFGTAMAQMFGKMIEDMIAKVIELIAEYLILNAVAAAFPGLGVVAPTVGGLLGKLIPGLAVGTPYVAQTGLALIHQGEAIVPAEANPYAGNGPAAVGGTSNSFGGNNVSLNISAIDGRSVANMLMSNKNVLNTVLSQIMRTNPGYMASMAQAGA